MSGPDVCELDREVQENLIISPFLNINDSLCVMMQHLIVTNELQHFDIINFFPYYF